MGAQPPGLQGTATKAGKAWTKRRLVVHVSSAGPVHFTSQSALDAWTGRTALCAWECSAVRSKGSRPSVQPVSNMWGSAGSVLCSTPSPPAARSQKTTRSRRSAPSLSLSLGLSFFVLVHTVSSFGICQGMSWQHLNQPCGGIVVILLQLRRTPSCPQRPVVILPSRHGLVHVSRLCAASPL